MPTAPPRELREHIARAGGYLRRNDVERAIASICAALRLVGALGLSGRARTEPDILIAEFLHDLVSHPDMAFLMDPGNTGTPREIPHKPGQESKLRVVLEGLAKLVREKSPARLQREAGERLARKRNLIESGLQFLHQGQTAKGNAFFKRAAEEFGDDKGIYLHLARLLMETGQTLSAAEMFEQAMEAQPREPAAYTGAVKAWMELREREKAETVYKAMLRALQTDPQQADALEALAALAALDKK
ncbi:MAG: tetratricopeptide repeat protein [Desulfovibrio sp.]|jgi:Tfp pilus assembly protein PilF|nr:tetratricopeptide repeat protein [Desulfovibrio sp.]